MAFNVVSVNHGDKLSGYANINGELAVNFLFNGFASDV